MNHSQTISKIAPALIKALSEIGPAPMDSVNPFLGNRYAGLGSVIETERPILAKYGLGITQLVTTDEQDRIGVETVLWHESGEWISGTITMPLPQDAQKGRSMAQEAGAVITYLRRYGLTAILSIYADEDTDANPTQPKKTTRSQQEPPGATPQVKTTQDSDSGQKKAHEPAQRPLAPDKIKATLERLAKENPVTVFTDKQRNLLRYCLELLFAGEPEDDIEYKRHAVLAYLTGVTSTRTVDGSLAKAMMDRWIKITKDEKTGDYRIDPMAAQEAQIIYTEATKDHPGQGALI